MASVQRAFAQKLSKQHAADVRRQIVNSSFSRDVSKSGSNLSDFSPTVSLSDIVDPLDYEEFIQHNHFLVDRDPLHNVLDFPSNDIEVGIFPRKIRTLEPIIPEEKIETLPAHIRESIFSYTADWLTVSYRYRHFSSSFLSTEDRLTLADTIPQQEFEIDLEPFHSDTISQEEDHFRGDSGDTPRGSWASFDLRNSLEDPLIPSLLERVPPDSIDRINEIKRQEERQDSLFFLYPPQEDEEVIERRTLPEIPCEHLGHRIRVKCLQLKLELEVEPIFASIALYDAKEKKKLSENFYFDMNSDNLKRMLTSHVPYSDNSTLSRSCILDVSYPSPDLFLVIRLEKVLQGDINECAEPYLKDDKNREKVKANALAACERLGKYRMPFAWTAIHVLNILNGGNSMERDSGSDKESTGSNSLDRKSTGASSSLEQLRKRASDMGSLTRRGSLERRASADKRRSWSPEDFGSSLDTFRPVTITVTSFFKQENDRLRDDDLYKFLQDLKRPCSVMKKLKCIPCSLKLDISPCVEEVKCCLNPDLVKLNPYPDEKARPVKEILEFPLKEVYMPHYSYRNLLYIYPKELNFASRAGSARNLTVKVQLMEGEDEIHALPLIFGRSSCPEYTNEAYTTVSYHNKCPDFYDEIKVKLPANLGDNHHLLFTFYHISCQRKNEQPNVETPVGYTWVPLCRDGRLQHGELCLPVMVDKPPANYSFISADVLLPGTKWLDNHKALFVVHLEPVSSVHTRDHALDRFMNVWTMLVDGIVPACICDLRSELQNSMLELSNARLEPLVRFLPLVLDKLIKLLVWSPSILGQQGNMSQVAFEALGMLVRKVTTLQEGQLDRHGRHGLLATYIHYQCQIPKIQSASFTKGQLPRSCSNPNIHSEDEEIGQISARAAVSTLDRTCSMKNGATHENLVHPVPLPKVLHEELAIQWVVSSGSARELAMANAWFLMELMVKSMVVHLAATHSLEAPRKCRFPEQYLDDVTTLVTTITADIISRYSKDSKLSHSLNSSLAFFLFDLISVCDRGFVLGLIKSYCKQISAKILSLPDAAGLVSLKLNLLRIVCCHEHFVALNLPFGTPFTPSSAPSSPTSSIASSTSQLSFVSTAAHTTDRSSFAELSPEFRQQHFLVGLILTDLASVLEIQNPILHLKSVNLVRNLMTSHDRDPRYSDPACKARVAALYLPLLSVALDTLPQLFVWTTNIQAPVSTSASQGNTSTPGGTTTSTVSSGINQTLAMAIAGTEVFSHLQQSGNRRINQIGADATRHLLICVLWVLKNIEYEVLRRWTSELSGRRLHELLELLNLCIACFEYKGKKALRRSAQQNFCKITVDIKSRLEDVILGQGSARSELIQRRKAISTTSAFTSVSNTCLVTSCSSGNAGLNAVSGGSCCASGNCANMGTNPGSSELRWRKDQMAGFRPSSSESIDKKPRGFLETDARLDGCLASEASHVILDTLETIVQVASQSDTLLPLLGPILKVLLHALSRNQSTRVLRSMFATQRSLVFKFPNLLFDEESELCADLCLQLLKHCSSALSAVRSQASGSLYLLMRQNFEIGNNFARVKMQVTMSLSSLVGTSASFSEESLRRSLKTILVYAEADTELQETSFPEQVKDLVFNLHMILSDTVKMKEFQEDPEMLLDLMYRIAKGYQNSPDLRLTWLANMAQKHLEHKHPTEAGMCLVQSAALVAEYLHMLEDVPYLPVGAASLEQITPNAAEESAVSDDVLSPDEEGICLGKDFTESGLVGLLEHAATAFHSAGMYEVMNDVYKVLIPIVEINRDFKKLANIHCKLHEAFTRIDQLHGKRVFGTYFRVGFYGSKFGDLDGDEFIYKEPTLTKLPEIFGRLEKFYAERFGSENIVIIKDSNPVDVSSLDPDKAYIQITYVEPYFETYELRTRVTHFDKNFNMKRFVYATPFTMGGRAHGELHEQYKRKTILTTANHFPYVKTRIQVIDRRQIVLTPIEVAIEDIQKKTMELAQATQQEPPDPKILQMVLQGCIGTTVNQGPMEIAVVFLSCLLDGQKPPNKFQNKLRLCFKDFSKKCADALRKNKNLIGPDQKDYQRELERNYQRFTERLTPLISIPPLDRAPRIRR